MSTHELIRGGLSERARVRSQEALLVMRMMDSHHNKALTKRNNIL